MVSKGYGIFSGRLVKLLSGSRFQVSLMMMFDMNDPILKLGEPPKEMAIHAFSDLPSCRPEDFEDVRTCFAGGGDDTSFSESAIQKIAPAKVSPRKLKAAERCYEQLSGIVKYGVIEILRAFLKSRKEEFDIAAIKDSIKALTARDGMEPIAELLKPLYLNAAAPEDSRAEGETERKVRRKEGEGQEDADHGASAQGLHALRRKPEWRRYPAARRICSCA